MLMEKHVFLGEKMLTNSKKNRSRKAAPRVENYLGKNVLGTAMNKDGHAGSILEWKEPSQLIFLKTAANIYSGFYGKFLNQK